MCLYPVFRFGIQVRFESRQGCESSVYVLFQVVCVPSELLSGKWSDFLVLKKQVKSALVMFQNPFQEAAINCHASHVEILGGKRYLPIKGLVSDHLHIGVHRPSWLLHSPQASLPRVLGSMTLEASST
jgi:hypothetical protein